MKKIIDIVASLLMLLGVGIAIVFDIIGRIFKNIRSISFSSILKEFKNILATIISKIKNFKASNYTRKQKLASIFVCVLLFTTFSNDFVALSQNLIERPCQIILVDGEESVKIPLNINIDIEEELNKRITELEGRSIKITSKIEVIEGVGYGYEVNDVTQITNDVINDVEYEVLGVQLLLNQEPVCIVESFSVLNEVLDEFKAPYMDDKYYFVDFKEDIEFQEKFAKKEDLHDKEELVEFLSSNKSEKIEHTIVSGDTFWDLSIANEITVQDLIYANPSFTEETVLQLGDVIVIANAVPMLSVRTFERVTYEAPAEFETEYIKNDQEFVTYEKVVTEGVAGVKNVTADIVSDNGVQTDKLIIEEKIIVEPISEVIEIGTMNTPPKKSVGTFVFPTTGRISDRFLTRGGRHKGIDIANASGTSIKASDGGRVEYAGWQSGFGNLVIINHDNGYTTYYAHNSKLTVSVGQMVAQGEEIAKMGTTGRSTGNHCHFEIRLNGVPQNPFDYVTY